MPLASSLLGGSQPRAPQAQPFRPVPAGLRVGPGRHCAPPRLQENETWWLCDCTKAVCKHDNVVELVPVECEPPPMPTCSNSLTPVRVLDPDGCCWHWECDCEPAAPRGPPPRLLPEVPGHGAQRGRQGGAA